MECVYDTFEFLTTAPIFEQVQKMRDENFVKFHNAINKVERCKDKTKKKQYTNIALKHAAILHLCDFFLLNKESHDMHMALMTLDTLSEKEENLVARSEFEGAALVRDEIAGIRNYLTKLNKKKNGSETSESSIVNSLRPTEVSR